MVTLSEVPPDPVELPPGLTVRSKLLLESPQLIETVTLPVWSFQ